MRSSSRNRRAAALGLAAAIAIVAAGRAVSAHRTDEYLQAARIAIDPDRVEIALDMTAGIAVAPSILAAIDRNADGSLSAAEQRRYAGSVLAGLELEIDGRRRPLQLGGFTFPSPASSNEAREPSACASRRRFRRCPPGHTGCSFATCTVPGAASTWPTPWFPRAIVSR